MQETRPDTEILETPVAILEAYFDESGVHPDSDTVCVAGYLASRPSWIAFRKDWQNALNEWGLQYYHHSELLHGNGLYHGMSAIRKDSLYVQITKIIREWTFASAAVRIRRSAYDTIFSKEAKHVSAGIYGFAAVWCMAKLATYATHKVPAAAVSYFYAKGAPHSAQIEKGFETLCSCPVAKEELKVSSISFLDARQEPPLQAADILATEHYRDRKRSRSPILSGPGPFLKVLLAKGDNFLDELSDEDLEKWNAKFLPLFKAQKIQLAAARRERKATIKAKARSIQQKIGG